MDHEVTKSTDFDDVPGFSNSSSDSSGDSSASIDFSEIAEPQDAKKVSANTGYKSKVKVLDRYKVVGFISSGTYGRVYKAVGHNGQSGEFAIKKFVDYNLG